METEMIPDPQDMTPLDIPRVIHACRLRDRYDVEIVSREGFGPSFSVEVSWISPRTRQQERFSVDYSAHCSCDEIWISRYCGRDLVFHPSPQDNDTYIELLDVWRDAGIEDLVHSQKLAIGRYSLAKTIESWRRSFFLTEQTPERRQEFIDDAWFFAEQAMSALLTQFPDEDHIFPTPLPEPIAGFGM
tara:strand:- start:3967 stop:4530 length:564 start_codon:yes stop_codon:yes gene_type:complete